MTKTLADTEEWARPNAGAQCTISYAARLLPAAGGTLFDERTADNPLLFTTDEGGWVGREGYVAGDVGSGGMPTAAFISCKFPASGTSCCCLQARCLMAWTAPCAR